MVRTTSTEEPGQSWLRPAALVALVYPIVGITFASPLHASSSHAATMAWRLAAWLASAATFALHLGYEHRRPGRSPLRGALHGSAAVALGALLLAVWINARALWSASTSRSPLAPLALVIFPAVTGVPAFLVGLGALTVLRRFQGRSR